MSAVERDLAGGQTHAYTVTLAAGQFLRVVVEQRGVDVALRFYAPDGKLFMERDRPNGRQEPESLSAEVMAAGVYRLDVAALAKDAPAGKYTIGSETPRPATPQDKPRLRAEQLFQEALALRQTGKPDDAKTALEKWAECLKLWRETGDAYAEVLTLQQMAAASLALGDERQAREYSQAAFKKAEAGKYERLTAALRENLLPPEAQAFLAEFEAARKLMRQGAERKPESLTQARAKLNESLIAYRSLGKRLDEVFAFDKLSSLYTREKLAVFVANQRYALRSREVLALDSLAGVTYQEATRLYDENKPEAVLQARAKAVAALEAWRSLEKMLDETFDLRQYEPHIKHEAIENGKALMQFLADAGAANALSTIALTYNYFGEMEEVLKYSKLALAATRKLRSGKDKNASTCNRR